MTINAASTDDQCRRAADQGDKAAITELARRGLAYTRQQKLANLRDTKRRRLDRFGQ